MLDPAVGTTMNPPESPEKSSRSARPKESLPFSPSKRNFMPYSDARNLLASSASLPPRWSMQVQEKDKDEDEDGDDTSIERRRRVTLWGSEDDLNFVDTAGSSGTSWSVKAVAWGQAFNKAFKIMGRRLGIAKPPPHNQRPRSRVTQSM